MKKLNINVYDMKRLFITILSLALALGANAQKKKELTTVVDVNYCLPKVVYQLEVTMECTHAIPGPYWKYAEKELGMVPKIVQDEERWVLKDVRVKPLYVPDEKAVYTVAASVDYSSLTLSLSAEGFLAGVCAGNGAEAGDYGTLHYKNDEVDEVEYVDIMKFKTYNYLKEVLDTNYTFQEIDGEMKKIWDPIIRYERKSEMDNVKEAVSEIFRIRAERVQLLEADNDVPDGKSLDIILREYDRMEANYLSLFLGKEEKRRVKRVVTCAPVKIGEPVVAFRFSPKEGITDVKNVSAQTYALRLSDAIVPASDEEAKGEVPAIYYRVPAIGTLQLLRGKEVVMSTEAVVPQLGMLKRFPIEVITNEGLALEFHPQFGSLKSVKKK